jgi:gamma-glutamylcyclotransferase (GGCT)/AIG2-like uncharacterized protein YtfP
MQDRLQDRLFVFGTLLSGYDHPMAQLLVRDADLLGEARCNGRLYLVKHYPGMVLSDDPAEQVFGELYRLREPRALLRVLDEYEGYGEGFPEPYEFVRQECAVTLRNGEAGAAWVYLYNRPVDGLPQIPSGRFLDH